MLRRDFIKAALAFTAAATSAKAALVAASPGCGASEKFVACRCGGGDDLGVDLGDVSTFERTLVDCLRDGSMVLIGVTGSSIGYEAFYRPAKTLGELSQEKARHDTLMAMHARGMIVVEDVTVWNSYDAVSIRFAICTHGA